MQTEKSRFTKPKKKMDEYDRAINLMYFVFCCLAVYRFSCKQMFVPCLVFGLLALWFLKNELLYGGRKRGDNCDKKQR